MNFLSIMLRQINIIDESMILGPHYKNNNNEVIDLSERVLEFIIEK